MKIICFHPAEKVISLLVLLTWFNCFVSAQNPSTDQAGKLSRLKRITEFYHQQAAVRYIYQAELSPDASRILFCADGKTGNQEISLLSVQDPGKIIGITAASQQTTEIHESEPQWSPDGSRIAFLSDAGSKGQVQIYLADAQSGQLIFSKPVTAFDGFVSHLKWSPDSRSLSVLLVEKASREPSPMAAENRAVGLIDSALNKNVQRIFVLDVQSKTGKLISPPALYIFEYDWSPDSKKFAYTAAVPPGDDNWYIARLYAQQITDTVPELIYVPKKQVALPRWSPQGKQIAFIEGLMSDQGGTGGEIFIVHTDHKNVAENLTPGRKSTPSWFCWQGENKMLFTEFTGGSVAIQTLNLHTHHAKFWWKGDESIRAGLEEMSLSVRGNVDSPVVALIRTGWQKYPEISVGTLQKFVQVTHLNNSNETPMPRSKNIEWMNEGYKIQGWLLYPQHFDSAKKYPMLVCVHGGPAWIATPTWSAPDFNTTVYTQMGYFVFFPNARGSYGQGEAFTMANRRDWGFGDLRDIISGVKKVLSVVPVNRQQVGMLGWSYGGSMAMMAVTQTHLFGAAVAGAGAGDWLSYYGQNSIDKWMLSYFGASPYADPAAYTKCSAMTYIKNAKTPTLVLVGERDGESPSPQSFQFWHALKELHVPAELMVYADEGHSFSRLEDMVDITSRTLEWFNRWLQPGDNNASSK